ncbi:MAG: hypothetical protein OCC49_13640 [Fibrobacterales bacterium]
MAKKNLQYLIFFIVFSALAVQNCVFDEKATEINGIFHILIPNTIPIGDIDSVVTLLKYDKKSVKKTTNKRQFNLEYHSIEELRLLIDYSYPVGASPHLVYQLYHTNGNYFTGTYRVGFEDTFDEITLIEINPEFIISSDDRLSSSKVDDFSSSHIDELSSESTSSSEVPDTQSSESQLVNLLLLKDNCPDTLIEFDTLAVMRNTLVVETFTKSGQFKNRTFKYLDSNEFFSLDSVEWVQEDSLGYQYIPGEYMIRYLYNAYTKQGFVNGGNCIWVDAKKGQYSTLKKFEEYHFGFDNMFIHDVALDTNDQLLVGFEKTMIHHSGSFVIDSSYHNYESERLRTMRRLQVDSEGNSWFNSEPFDGVSTDRYVVKFDGLDFTTYGSDVVSLFEYEIEQIYTANDGSVWFLTDEGFARYFNKAWTVFNTENTNKLTHSSITAIVEADEGEFWIAGGYSVSTQSMGIAQLIGDSIGEVYNSTNSNLPHDKILSLEYSSKGVLWIGLYEQPGYNDGELCMLKDQNITCFNSELFKGKGVSVIQEDRSGQIWLSIGISIFIYNDDVLTHLFDIDSSARAIVIDKKMNAWVPSYIHGFTRISYPKNRVFLNGEQTW